MFLPELYALQHPKFFKFHAPTSSLAHALFLYLLPLSGTHFLTAFVSVNLYQLSGNILKHFIISNWHSLAPPSDPLPQRASASRFNFWFLVIHWRLNRNSAKLDRQVRKNIFKLRTYAAWPTCHFLTIERSLSVVISMPWKLVSTLRPCTSSDTSLNLRNATSSFWRSARDTSNTRPFSASDAISVHTQHLVVGD